MLQPADPNSAAVAPTSAASPAELSQRLRLHKSRWSLIGLFVLIACIGMVRWRFLDAPLERDEGEFAYGAQRILAGEIPYVSFYAMKLPGIYVTYAVMSSFFGEHARGIHLGLFGRQPIQHRASVFVGNTTF